MKKVTFKVIMSITALSLMAPGFLGISETTLLAQGQNTVEKSEGTGGAENTEQSGSGNQNQPLPTEESTSNVEEENKNTTIDTEKNAAIKATSFIVASSEAEKLGTSEILKKANASAWRIVGGQVLPLAVVANLTSTGGSYVITFRTPSGAKHNVIATVTDKDTTVDVAKDTALYAKNIEIDTLEAEALTQDGLKEKMGAKAWKLSTGENLVLNVAGNLEAKKGVYTMTLTTEQNVSHTVEVKVVEPEVEIIAKEDAQKVVVGDMVYHLDEDQRINRAEQFDGERKIALYYYFPGTQLNGTEKEKVQYKYTLNGDTNEYVVKMDEYNTKNKRVTVSHFAGKTTYANWRENIVSKDTLEGENIVRTEEYNAAGRISISLYQANTSYNGYQATRLVTKHILSQDGTENMIESYGYNASGRQNTRNEYFSGGVYGKNEEKVEFSHTIPETPGGIRQITEYNIEGYVVKITRYYSRVSYGKTQEILLSVATFAGRNGQNILKLEEYNSRGYKSKVTEYAAGVQYYNRYVSARTEYLLSENSREYIVRADEYAEGGSKINYSLFKARTKYGEHDPSKVIKVVAVDELAGYYN
ncbi:MAG: hypothetical protein ACRC6X_05770 [Culicoidibacterales bacterium]